MEEDEVQPALDETCFGCPSTQRIFQPCQRTYHAKKGLGGNVQDSGKVGKPESSISHKAHPYPVTHPDQWQTADDKQHEQKMND